jgi:hypothetical protein
MTRSKPRQSLAQSKTPIGSAMRPGQGRHLSLLDETVVDGHHGWGLRPKDAW